MPKKWGLTCLCGQVAERSGETYIGISLQNIESDVYTITKSTITGC
nr:MAG TPA: hypothetical protein [Caudoviricetes sp.]